MADRIKRPAYQFYPRDERADTALQACPLVARGLWHEMQNIMHDGDPYGHLRIGGRDMSVEELARYVGEPLGKVRAWVALLEDRNVFSRTDEGTIYSRRMVRDEHNRNVRAAGGKESLNHPAVPRPKDHSKDIAGDSTNGRGRYPSIGPSVDTSGDPLPPSSGGSPASASAFASASEITPSGPPTSGGNVARGRSRALVPTADEQRVLDHYRATHPRRGPADDKQVRVVRKALASFSVDQLCRAIDGNAGDPWHAERRKHELTYVLRDNDMVSGFIDRYEQQQAPLVGENGELTDAGKQFFAKAS